MNRRNSFGMLTPSDQMVLIAFSVFLLWMVAANVGVWLWSKLVSGIVYKETFVSLPIRILVGKVTLEPVAWVFVGAVAVAIAVIIGLLGTVVFPNGKYGKTARLAGGRADTQSINEKSIRDKAKRLGVNIGIGLPIAKTVYQVRKLFSSWEDVAVLLAGPRTGKTTSWAVPRILAAGGAVIATSNKRDILESTRYVREDSGHRSWIFDPQNIGGTSQTWWWNPLSYVTNISAAEDMAKVFDSSIHGANESKNAYFGAESQMLVACLLLAAAKANYPITRLVKWLAEVNDDEPIMILRRSEDTKETANRLEGIYGLPFETKGGVFGGANQLVSFLTNKDITKWITPPEHGFMPHFDAEEFVRSNDTLYLLSQEGKGNATAVVTALTVAVIDEAKNLSELNGGRLPTPIYVCLDEAANVCKWAELPNMYSHFGSRGIVVDTILQSWSQGVEVWGENGMNKLWSAANVKVYAGGITETGFLETLSKLIGKFTVDSFNVSHGKQGRSVSTGVESQERDIAPVSELAALKSGFAWVVASTSTPVLCKMQPWYTTSLKPLVEDSISRSKAGAGL